MKLSELDRRFRKRNCPICGYISERLEPFEDGIYEYFCPECSTTTVITVENWEE